MSVNFRKINRMKYHHTNQKILSIILKRNNGGISLWIK